jgi:hypothetical protein
MRTLMKRLKRLWTTPVEFYGVDRPGPQAGPWQGLMIFVVLIVLLGLLWLRGCLIRLLWASNMR